MLYTHPPHARLARASSRLRSSAVKEARNWGLAGGGGRRSGRIFLRNKKLRVPRSWLRGSGRIGPGRRSCCGSRRGGCDGGCAGAQHSRQGRPRQPAVLVDAAAAAAAIRALHEQAAATTGAAAPAVFGPRGGTRSRLPGRRRLSGVRMLSAAGHLQPIARSPRRPAELLLGHGQGRPASHLGDPPAVRGQPLVPGLPGCGGPGAAGRGQGGRARSAGG